ncbi:MAG: lysylphosphatidylglycerol synthase transmembrane domain-containing protein [Desulfuromonadales bacterium]|nr:lysylphosphatidylglycerol synthase transmembrane domain-containing protein [Desulfuromonadales bacterium]
MKIFINKKNIKNIVKFVFIISVVIYLSTLISAKDMIDLFGNLSIIYVFFAVLVCLFDKILMGLKWNILLSIFDKKVTYFSCVVSYLKAKVLHLFTPSSIGEDLYKIYYMNKNNIYLPGIVSSIVIERSLGAISSLGLISLFLHFSVKYLREEYLYQATVLGFFLFFSIVFFIYFLIFYSENLKKISFGKILPPRLNDKFIRLLAAMALIGEHRKRIWLYFVFSVFEKMLYGTAIFLSAAALGLDNISYMYIVAAAPLLALLERLPISLAAFGVRESLIVVLLSPFSITTTSAVSVALVLRLAEIIVSILCSILWLVDRQDKNLESEIRKIEGTLA